jgi:hypothetical protein
MPRFVILEHDHPALHWDLLLEAGTVLRAWRLKAPPTSGETTPAEANADHRLFYLDYEGPVSGGRGTVQRWDAGEFRYENEQDDLLDIRIAGGRLNGTLRLERLSDGNWSCTYLCTDPHRPLE